MQYKFLNKELINNDWNFFTGPKNNPVFNHNTFPLYIRNLKRNYEYNLKIRITGDTTIENQKEINFKTSKHILKINNVKIWAFDNQANLHIEDNYKGSASYRIEYRIDNEKWEKKIAVNKTFAIHHLKPNKKYKIDVKLYKEKEYKTIYFKTKKIKKLEIKSIEPLVSQDNIIINFETNFDDRKKYKIQYSLNDIDWYIAEVYSNQLTIYNVADDSYIFSVKDINPKNKKSLHTSYITVNNSKIIESPKKTLPVILNHFNLRKNKSK